MKRISASNFLTVLIFIATIPLGEVTGLLPHYDDPVNYSFFLFSDDMMPYVWYYHFLIRAITWVIIMWGVVRVASNQSSDFIYIATKIYFAYRVFDLCAFILCKSDPHYYYVVYLITALYAMIIYVKKIRE